MFKSIAIVVGSYLLSVALVFATDPLLSSIFPGDFVSGRIPSNASLAASTLLFILISIVCAGLCAFFSRVPERPYVLWFLVLGEIMGIAASIPNWGNGWPHWYSLSWILSWPVSCWLGYVLALRIKARRRGMIRMSV